MAATPTLNEAIDAVKTALDAISPSIGSVLTGFHTLADDVEFIENGSYKSSGSMNLFFIEGRSIPAQEGPSPGEFYEPYEISIRLWTLRTANADWSKEARAKAELARDELEGNPDVFRIGGQVPLRTPETVQLIEHSPTPIRDEAGEEMVYQTELRLTVEGRRFGSAAPATSTCTPTSLSCIIAQRVFADTAGVFGGE